MSGERDGALEIFEMELLSYDIDTEEESQTYFEFSAINAISSLFYGYELS